MLDPEGRVQHARHGPIEEASRGDCKRAAQRSGATRSTAKRAIVVKLLTAAEIDGAATAVHLSADKLCTAERGIEQLRFLHKSRGHVHLAGGAGDIND